MGVLVYQLQDSVHKLEDEVRAIRRENIQLQTRLGNVEREFTLHSKSTKFELHRVASRQFGGASPFLE